MYQNILVPIDGSDSAFRGLMEAIKVAKSQHAQLRLFHVLNEYVLDCSVAGGVYIGGFLETLHDQGTHFMHDAETLVGQHGLRVESRVRDSHGGPTAPCILEEALSWPADLIVMGTHGRHGVRRLAMGSDAESVVRESLVPVLLVRRLQKDLSAHQHRLVGLNGADRPETASRVSPGV